CMLLICYCLFCSLYRLSFILRLSTLLSLFPYTTLFRSIMLLIFVIIEASPTPFPQLFFGESYSLLLYICLFRKFRFFICGPGRFLLLLFMSLLIFSMLTALNLYDPFITNGLL